ncbi:MAG: metal-dependent hydrolase [Rubrobacter sp.]|nr:metal-dependent hydrolase [Rubrobacter sp.]
MMGHTHLTGGALAGLAVSYGTGLGFEEAAALTIGAIATSKLPDVDARIIRGPDHRSFPHTVILGGGTAVVLALVAYVWISANASNSSLGPLGPGTVALLAPGAAIGYLAHLALDASTKSGIWLLLPKDKRVGLPRKYAVRTGSPTELLISGGMALVTLVLAVAVFAPALGGMEIL